MKTKDWVRGLPLLVLALIFAGCGRRSDPAAEAPPPPQVEQEQDLNVIKVDHSEQFPLVAAGTHTAVSQLVVTGVVTPDISRTVPAISLASGRVVEIHARLGDTVQKGQLLMRVQSSDISGAYSDYQKAVADETLAKAQVDRANDLYGHGATSLGDLQLAQDAAKKAQIDVAAAAARLRLLGGDLDHPAETMDVVAPVSGVITDQQVTNAGGVQALGSNPFTISDLSYVWIVCDVFENDLAGVRIGETADIRLNAYPGQILRGVIGYISPILDPTIRTAKVRIELRNPGLLRVGMFVTATFHGMTKENRATLPADAILHLRDRDWVFVPAGPKQFRRSEVVGGEMLPNNLQEVVSGLKPGDQVVSKALDLQNAASQ